MTVFDKLYKKQNKTWNSCNIENVEQHPEASAFHWQPGTSWPQQLASLLLSPRTELHLNHLAEKSAFGILPLSKVTTQSYLTDRCLFEGIHFTFSLCDLCGLLWSLKFDLTFSPPAWGQAASLTAVHQAAGSHEGAGHLWWRAEGPLAHLGSYLSLGGCRSHKRYRLQIHQIFHERAPDCLLSVLYSSNIGLRHF